MKFIPTEEAKKLIEKKRGKEYLKQAEAICEAQHKVINLIVEFGKKNSVEDFIIVTGASIIQILSVVPKKMRFSLLQSCIKFEKGVEE